MPRFFLRDIPDAADTIIIEGNDAGHIINSLRMSKGEAVTVCDGCGTDYSCVVEKLSEASVYLKIYKRCKNISEPSVFAVSYFSLPKGDKAETVIQKAVELGASKIVPFISERCISRPDEKGLRKKHERYIKISEEAAKQCGRGIIPYVSPVISFEEAVDDAISYDIPLILYEAESRCSIKQALSQKEFKSAAVMSGPEGGFSAEEIQYAAKAGLISVSLGKRILRCETAPIAGLCAVMYQSDNLG